ncbi:related to adult brain 239 [Lecanosticta acicola]|uniref:Related to adult brain 239 n=1 Tax=Lecanosticta acicola TaxID=111012 RepID=A0AAI8YSP4_9PEZI|nr:related to adult brain 239 [Lecanosticta acicola]
MTASHQNRPSTPNKFLGQDYANRSIEMGIPSLSATPSNTKKQPPKSPYEIPTIRQQLQNPIKLLARLAEFHLSLLRSDRNLRRNITLVCISDTHCLLPASVPYGDVLIHAGDMTNAGTPGELQRQIDWMQSLPHRYKVVIAGNHDTFLDPKSRGVLGVKDREGKVDWKDVVYLQDSSTILDFSDRTSLKGGMLKIYGSPHTPDLLGPEHAFQHFPRGTDIWDGTIPKDADVVVTHGPPKYHLDLPGVVAMGDEFLLREIRRVKPAVHVFGHIHAGKSDCIGQLRGGQELVHWDSTERHFEGAARQTARFDLSRRIAAFYHLGMLFLCGVTVLIQDRVFGMDTSTTRLVNAAMVYCNTGKLGNEPQVVHI